MKKPIMFKQLKSLFLKLLILFLFYLYSFAASASNGIIEKSKLNDNSKVKYKLKIKNINADKTQLDKNNSSIKINYKDNELLNVLKSTYVHRTFKSFSTAKSRLKKIFTKIDQSFYCQCPMSYPSVNILNCGISQDYSLVKSDAVLEFEHVLPMSKVKDSLLKKAQKVIRSYCTKSVSRKCLLKNLEFFSYFESDMFNIRAAVKKINRLKSSKWLSFDLANFSLSVSSSNKRCNFKINDKKVVLPSNVRGDVARIMLYLDNKYEVLDLISPSEKQNFLKWSKLDPVTKQEMYLIKEIANIQNKSKIPKAWQ